MIYAGYRVAFKQFQWNDETKKSEYLPCEGTLIQFMPASSEEEPIWALIKKDDGGVVSTAIQEITILDKAS